MTQGHPAGAVVRYVAALEDFGDEQRACAECGRLLGQSGYYVERRNRPEGVRYYWPPRCRDCANAARNARHKASKQRTHQEVTEHEENDVSKSTRWGSSGQNRHKNLSSMGYHMDAAYRARLTRWGRLLRQANIHDVVAFQLVHDADLRAIDGLTDEALRTIRRAIKDADAQILQELFAEMIFAAPPRPVAPEVAAVADQLAPQAPPPRPSLVPTWTSIEPPRAPPPEPLGVIVHASGAAPEAPKIEDAVAAARLLVEADERCREATALVADLQRQLLDARAAADVARGERDTAAALWLERT